MRKPLTLDQQDAIDRMRDVLREQFITLQVVGYRAEERFEESSSHIVATVRSLPSDATFDVEADGAGLVDAFFRALVDRYAPEHPSLESIRFTRFSVRGLMSEANSARATDARAEAEIGVTNSYGTEFEFGAVAHSVTACSLEAVIAAVEYFVNSERAYVQTFAALEHYRDEGRTDLVTKYTDMLADLVRNTSYSKVIETMRNGG